MKTSPLAPARFPDMDPVDGVQFATAATGVKYKGRDDVLLVHLSPGTAVAGVFTKSSTRADPVLDCQTKIGTESDAAAAFLINAGNANAFTGHQGQATVSELTQAVSRCLDLPESRVFTSSTGVIGEPLDHTQITAHLDAMTASLGTASFEAAASAIRTTDTYPKAACRTVDVDGKTVTLAGIAKGSGMIAPDMATMLVYIFTDAALTQSDAQSLVSNLADSTFNCITVDSDTSTSATLLVAATGASGVRVTENNLGFMEALRRVMTDLAHQVVRDGEGAQKLIEVRVGGAVSDASAKTVALAIANSPLVKTAIAGEDANWGRVVMAVGKAGEPAERDKLSIAFGGIAVAQNGVCVEGYDAAPVAAHLAGCDIFLDVDYSLGAGLAVVWTTLGIFNFAHGAFIAVGAYAAWQVGSGDAWGLGTLAGAVSAASECLGLRRLAAEPLVGSPTVW